MRGSQDRLSILHVILLCIFFIIVLFLNVRTNHMLCTGGNTSFVQLYQFFSTFSREIVYFLWHVLLFCEQLKTYLLFISVVCYVSHPTDLDKSGLNPMYLSLYTTAIFAAQHRLPFVAHKNISIVFSCCLFVCSFIWS